MTARDVTLAKDEYDPQGRWVVYVDGARAGSVLACWPGRKLYSSRPAWQPTAGLVRLGKPCKTRNLAVAVVVDRFERTR